MKLDDFVPRLTTTVLDEGVNDPAIFKLIFIVGGPGSGKSYISGRLGLKSLGYTVINSDVAFEYLMKQHGLDPKMPEKEKLQRDVVRQRAKDITGTKLSLAIDGRLGIVVDGTGDDYEKIVKIKNNFDLLGYNNFLIVVHTDLEVARARNMERQRSVPDDIVVQSWLNVQANIAKFKDIFENSAVINNSGTDKQKTEDQIQSTYKMVQKFTATPPNKPAATKWISSAGEVNEAVYPGNIGAMEVWQFKQASKNNPELWVRLKKLIAAGKNTEAWELIQDVVGVRLKEAEQRTAASKEIRTTLRNAGYKLLGSGADATVWAKKEGPVTKIIMPDDGEGAGQAGDTFMKFYEFCKKNPGIEALPKFSGREVEVFNADGKNYIMATMERLKPIPKESLQEAMVWLLSDLATEGMTWKKALNFMLRPGSWKNWQGNLTPDQIVDGIKSLSRYQRLEYEVLFKLMTLLYRHGLINKLGWDLHTENAMMRGNKIVITDPWFASKTIS